MADEDEEFTEDNEGGPKLGEEIDEFEAEDTPTFDDLDSLGMSSQEIE